MITVQGLVCWKDRIDWREKAVWYLGGKRSILQQKHKLDKTNHGFLAIFVIQRLFLGEL